MWTVDQMRALASAGYIVVPNVVPASLCNAALARIDALIREQQPPPGNPATTIGSAPTANRS